VDGAFEAAMVHERSCVVMGSSDIGYATKYWEALRNRAAYAGSLGYPFIHVVASKKRLQGRGPYFVKVVALAHVLGLEVDADMAEEKEEWGCETAVWMDHDAWFERGLTDLIPLSHFLERTGDASLIFPDLTYNLGPVRELTTAIFLLRRTEFARELIRRWWGVSSDGAFNNFHASDQAALGHVYASMASEEIGLPYELSDASCRADVPGCWLSVSQWLSSIRESSVFSDVTRPMAVYQTFFWSKFHWPSLMSFEFHLEEVPSNIRYASFAGHSGAAKYQDHARTNVLGNRIPTPDHRPKTIIK